MNKKEKLFYLKEKSVAYYSACGGVEVKKIEYGINDYIIAVCGAWTGKKSVHRVKINYTTTGRAFIRLHGYTMQLNDFIRI